MCFVLLVSVGLLLFIYQSVSLVSVERRERNANNEEEKDKQAMRCSMKLYIFWALKVLKRHCSIVSASVLLVLHCYRACLAFSQLQFPSRLPIDLPSSFPSPFHTLLSFLSKDPNLDHHSLKHYPLWTSCLLCVPHTTRHYHIQQNKSILTHSVLLTSHSCQ